MVIYEAFVEGKLEAPRYLARTVHDLYFERQYKESRSRTIWSLSNAFTSAFKELKSIPQFKATREARRVSGDSILAVVLTCDGTGRAAARLYSLSTGGSLANVDASFFLHETGPSRD